MCKLLPVVFNSTLYFYYYYRAVPVIIVPRLVVTPHNNITSHGLLACQLLPVARLATHATGQPGQLDSKNQNDGYIVREK